MTGQSEAERLQPLGQLNWFECDDDIAAAEPRWV